jgi:putative ABC transport system substrate-binding protein
VRRPALTLTTLALGLVWLVSSTAAQHKTWRVGLLSNSRSVPTLGDKTTWADELLVSLAQEGFHLGANLELVARLSEGEADRLPALARELAAADLDVIVAVSDPSVRAMRAASEATPIVMVVGADPVASGFVGSMARPGGRITGLALQTFQGDVKRLQFLREVFPGSTTFGVLLPPVPYPTEALEKAAALLNTVLTLRTVPALGRAEYTQAIASMRNEGVSALLVAASQAWFGNSVSLGEVAQEQGLATICEWDFMARAGCVFAYGHDLLYARRRAGWYAARVMKGQAPSDLPVEQPDAWKLTVNLLAAARVGVVVPPSLLARADEVIE